MSAPAATRPSDRYLHGPLPRSAWFGAVGLASLVLVLGRTTLGVPDVLVETAAVLVLTAYAGALAHRTGGRPVVSAGVGLVVGVAGVVSDGSVVTAGAALATAVIAALLAVVVTVPARALATTTREVAVAFVLAGVGALAVSAYDVSLSSGRLRYLALAASLVGVLTLVNGLVVGLGAGLHGLGRRGAAVLVGGALLLVVAIAYGDALGRWGSADLVDLIATVRREAVAHLHAVPHPVEALVGWPALTWGISMRARRRQGWWVCVFGVAATVSTSCALVDPGVDLARAALGSGYSLLVGLLLGWVAIRLELALTGPRGRRSRRTPDVGALRPEPGRTQALR